MRVQLYNTEEDYVENILIFADGTDLSEIPVEAPYIYRLETDENRVEKLGKPQVQTQLEIWQDVQAAGWTDSVTGIKLKTTLAAKDMFVSGLVLWQAVLSAGYVQPTDMTRLWDYNEEEQELTYADAMGLIIRYGIAWQALYAEYAP